MADCNVCCEAYNKMKRKKIACPKCDYEICRTCVETYLLGTHQDPHCMNCKHVWDREFLDSACTKVFVSKSLKTHRENILFEREKCLMPETQPYVEREILLRRMKAELEEETRIFEEARLRLRDKMFTYDRLRNAQFTGDVNELEKAKFCRKCPVDNCKGFLSTKWKCELCENHICKDCNEIKGEEHTCDPANVETTKLLAKDTKPCPSCGTMIFKISGCPQMWCTSCHVAFDWNTLRIEKGAIHNPHFFDFMRSNPHTNRLRAPGDIPCGGRPTVYELRDMRIDALFGNAKYQKLMNCLRLLHHIEGYLLRHVIVVRDGDNRDLRIKYMMNELCDEEFKTKVQAREKRTRFTEELRGVLQTYLNTMDDLLRQAVLATTSKDADEIFAVIIHLKEYTNRVMETVGKRYSFKSYVISDTLRDVDRV